MYRLYIFIATCIDCFKDLRGLPSAISIQVIPRDHKSLYKTQLYTIYTHIHTVKAQHVKLTSTHFCHTLNLLKSDSLKPKAIFVIIVHDRATYR